MKKKQQQSIVSTRLFNSQLTSIISISLVLFLLGIISTLFFVAKDVSSYVKENVGFTVILDTDIAKTTTQSIQKRIKSLKEVKSLTSITKEEAMETLIKELGEDPQDFLGTNPLSPSIEIMLKSEFVNNTTFEQLKTKIKKMKGVEEVLYRKDLIHSVNENVNRIGLLLLIITVLLLFISYALINNTVRLTIYSKRFLIHTMKLVGATRGFIRRPFIIQNILSGVVASILAMGILLLSLKYLANQLSSSLDFFDITALYKVFAVILLSGITITTLSAYFAVNKYLRMDRDKLYYI